MRILRHRAENLIGPDTPEGVVTFYRSENEQIWTLGVAEDASGKKSGDFRYVLFVASPERMYNGAFSNYSPKIPVAYSFNPRIGREKVTPYTRSSAIIETIARRDVCSRRCVLNKAFAEILPKREYKT